MYFNNFHLGCKGFYRRTVLTKAEYICRTGRGGCDLKMAEHPRQRCQKCRIERCEEVKIIIINNDNNKMHHAHLFMHITNISKICMWHRNYPTLEIDGIVLAL